MEQWAFRPGFRWLSDPTRWGRWRQHCMRTGLGLLFPPRCAYCGAANDLCDDGPLLCHACCELLTPGPKLACRRCGAGIAAAVDSAAGCANCQTHQLRFAEAIAMGPYAGHLRSAVLGMKHPTGEPLSASLARLVWQQHAMRLRSWRADVVVPIPMHWTRRMVRGVNSAEVLAETLAGELSLPFEPRLLRRRKNTAPQGDLSPDERIANLKNAFRLRRGCRVTGARVLLVDDILTTGATCSEAARELLRAGAAEAVVAVVARAEVAMLR